MLMLWYARTGYARETGQMNWLHWDKWNGHNWSYAKMLKWSEYTGEERTGCTGRTSDDWTSYNGRGRTFALVILGQRR